MKKTLLLILVLLIIPLAQAQDTCVYLFYGDGCPHCAEVHMYLDNLNLQDVNIQKFEIYNNRENAVLLNDFFNHYNVAENDRGVPVVFIGNEYLVGDASIENSLLEKINENIGVPCPQIQKTDEIQTLSLVTIIGAALVDSINPCAIAVLLILLGALMATGDKKRALKAGIGFTISIYIVYFLFGIGLFSALQISGLSFWFYKIIGFIAILLGLFNIKDYFRYGGGGFVMEIPRKWRPKLKNILNGVTSPIGAFLMGFVVCLFELPCTGGPYIFILGLLAEKTTQLGAIPLLLIYNLFFVIPLIVITGLVYTGYTNVGTATEWKEKNIRKLHLIAGIVMLILGIVVISGLV